MPELLIHNARVALADRIERGGVLVRERRIEQVFAGDPTSTGTSTGDSIDLGGAYLAPGLIDIHIHGSAGVDVMEADEDGLAELSQFLLAEGVTGYFATLVPAEESGYGSALKTINSYLERQARESRPTAARMLGVHFEGPFVNENRCGALKREYFRTYDGDRRSLGLFVADHSIGGARFEMARLMTLAPEIEGGITLTRDLTRSGARVFIGHSQADPDTLDKALQSGARHMTHFPNALDPLHHRRPGAVAWGLVRAEVTMDCIADFHHVDPLMLRLIYQSKGADRVALISDAIKPAGLGDGEFLVWGQKIAVQNGRTALATGPAAGTIAGSVITMRRALKNMIGLGVPVNEAIRMASLVPARASGVASDCGSIEVGKRADLVVFDEDFGVQLGIIGGVLAADTR